MSLPLPQAATAPCSAVLVVDDHSDSAQVVVRMLNRRGISVEAVQDGVAALELLKTLRPQVVVLDEMMPGLNGLEVLRRIRENRELAGVKVIFYSAMFDWKNHRDAYQLGATRWLVKGINQIDEVARLVQSLCAQKSN